MNVLEEGSASSAPGTAIAMRTSCPGKFKTSLASEVPAISQSCLTPAIRGKCDRSKPNLFTRGLKAARFFWPPSCFCGNRQPAELENAKVYGRRSQEKWK